MNESSTVSRVTTLSKIATVVGWGLVAVGVVVFAVRLQHAGPYAVPRGGNLFGGIGALSLGALLVWSGAPNVVRWIGLALTPAILFFALYAVMAELEEVVSLYATDSEGRPAELRLWIIDREDGEWVGMPRAKAVEHSLDGARLDLLRDGEIRCVVPTLVEDRAIVRSVHAQKVEKYAVARSSILIGVYPAEAPETSVSLRLDPCPGE